MTMIHPIKLLLSKWTAAQPVGKQKHFLVTEVIEPEVAQHHPEVVLEVLS